jgi:lactate permease
MSVTAAPPPVAQAPAAAKVPQPPKQSPASIVIGIIAFVAVIVGAVALLKTTHAQDWQQGYDPLGHWWLSTLCAALPIVVLLGSLAVFEIKAHYAALLGLITALIVAVAIFHMPLKLGLVTATYGAGYGLFPIGWIILSVIFMYQLTNETGKFKIMQESMMGVTQDRRLQLLLIAFCFGAFFEGASGFGTPVAVTAAILIGLGFRPLQASGLSLIANTAPVAFGALGIPIIALSGVTGMDPKILGANIGWILFPFCLLVPFWLIWAFAGFRGMIEVWPPILVAGGSFAVAQLLMALYHGPWLVDVVASVVSMVLLIGFLKIWKPKKIWSLEHDDPNRVLTTGHGHTKGEVIAAWTPWVILSVAVFTWGSQKGKLFLNTLAVSGHKFTVLNFPVTAIHNMISRMPPVVLKPTPEPALFTLNWLSATGTGILIAAVLSGFIMGCGPLKIARIYGKTIYKVRFSMMTIACMLGLGFLTRYSGVDATMGLAFARTGALYPFFGTMLGWLGVALTGSDTSSNVLFGSLQKITAQQIHIQPTLMASANSAGGVMGKMIDAQSIVVASTATQWYGHEGDILRYVFFHSLALAALCGLVVFLMAYVAPFTHLVH